MAFLSSSTECRPLPSTLTDFIAESICGILETQPQRCYNWDFVPLPELVLFVEKVTSKAKINVQTAVASLILVSRFKDNLPKNAHGEYGTCHKIFLSSLLVALKKFMVKNQDDEVDDDEEEHPEEMPAGGYDCYDSTSDFDHSSSILATTPMSVSPMSVLSSSSMSEDSILNSNGFFKTDRRHFKINQKFADISGIYNLQEVNQMERDFLRFLGTHNWVSDNDIDEYLENNKYALGIC